MPGTGVFNYVLDEPIQSYGEGRKCNCCGYPLSQYNRYRKCYACMDRDFELEVKAIEEEERRKMEAHRIRSREYYHRVGKARRGNANTRN